jgi:hypothetical protein
MPHPPQFCGSVIVLAHVAVPAQAVVPAGHTHWPDMQLAPMSHWWFCVGVVHAPQFCVSVETLEQPLAQGISFVGQTQTPAVQVEPGAHTWPHVMQLALSVCRLTHAPLQIVVPVGHWQMPETHIAPTGHEVPQLPQ